MYVDLKYNTYHNADYCISSRVYNLNIPYIALRLEINLVILSKKIPERIVEKQGGKLDFDRSSTEPIKPRKSHRTSFEPRIRQAESQQSRTITFKIGPKLEAPDPKYYREIQQSKLDRTVARIPCAGLQQSRCLLLDDNKQCSFINSSRGIGSRGK